MIATMKMIVLFLVTMLLLKYSLGNAESGSVETVDVAKKGNLKSGDVEGHIVESPDAIEGGNWRTEFEELIVNYSSQPRAQLARIACQYMYTKYPDITWVVIVYEPIAGYEKHTLLGGFSQTHFVYRYHGHNAIISRFAGERIAYDFGLERSLYDSFTPTCYAYCHDPDCLSKYYHVHTETTAFDTFLKLVSNSCSPFFFFTLQYRYSLYNYAGRRDSAGGVNAGRVFGTCSWDSRVVEAQIKTNCDGNYAKMILLGAKY